MGIFTRRKPEYPKMPEGDYEPILRCSVCTGEQTLCAKERRSGKLLELMLIRTPEDFEGFCRENDISSENIEKVY